jgi:hypothetical protein
MNFMSKREEKSRKKKLRGKFYINLCHLKSTEKDEENFPLGGMRNVNSALFKFFAYLFTDNSL